MQIHKEKDEKTTNSQITLSHFCYQRRNTLAPSFDLTWLSPCSLSVIHLSLHSIQSFSVFQLTYPNINVAYNTRIRQQQPSETTDKKQPWYTSFFHYIVQVFARSQNEKRETKKNTHWKSEPNTEQSALLLLLLLLFQNVYTKDILYICGKLESYCVLLSYWIVNNMYTHTWS